MFIFNNFLGLIRNYNCVKINYYLFNFRETFMCNEFTCFLITWAFSFLEFKLGGGALFKVRLAV